MNIDSCLGRCFHLPRVRTYLIFINHLVYSIQMVPSDRILRQNIFFQRFCRRVNQCPDQFRYRYVGAFAIAMG